MSLVFALLLPGALLLPLLWAAAPPAKSKAAASTPSRTRSAKGTRSRAKAKPSYQSHPDPERYQEIQRALADKGYFKGEVNGQWGDDSIDALKRFQADQKLDADGKISARTLIGLGLGPKHESASVVSPVPQTSPQQ
jgi:peptidoglycan hydrolase-like protein with peptidoglycan-binding domain